ncbi:MAG: SPFH domain-containing protein [Solobacterium sp.]|nr:SPFH domain-containing protein [Solobacterium sp.]
MGLIQAAISATTSTISDSWKEYFYCDAIPNDVLAIKGHKKVRGIGSNNGDDNIISDGSVISVADGQCMLIVENGKVVDICAEPGEFVYDSSTEPSLFTGSLDESVRRIFEQIGKRFTFGGQPADDQRVYYFNTKEIVGNKYGTANPVPFRVQEKEAGINLDVSLRCFGEYSLKLIDPVLFYTNVCGNFKEVYPVSELSDQLKSELLTALQPAFAKLSEEGIRYSEIPAHTKELSDLLNTELSEKWKDLRGLEIVSLGVNSITATEEDEARLKDMQAATTFKDPALATANLASATAQGIKEAAKNENGAAVGFMNMNAAQQAGGVNLQGMYQQMATPAAATWVCPKCGATCDGNFCSKCGEPRPVVNKWTCPQCAQENEGNFCSNCGTKRPE